MYLSLMTPSAHILATACLVVTLDGVTIPAWAQGYSLHQQGACEMGRSGAGVAAPCDDGSAAFSNPAGLATTRVPLLNVGTAEIPPRGGFTNDTTGRISTLNPNTSFVPTIYFAQPVGRRYTVGVGLFAPYGLASDWPATSEGRFIGYLGRLKSLYVQPTIAGQLTDRVQLGAGIDITHVSVRFRNRLDLASLPLPGAAPSVTFQGLGVPRGTDFADLDLKGSGVSVSGHFGVIVKASDHVSIGARYLMRQTIEIRNGQLATTQIPTGLTIRAPLLGVPAGMPIDVLVEPQFMRGQPIGPQSATTTLPLPDQLVAGVAVRASNLLTLLADYQFIHWSLLKGLDIHHQFAPETNLPQSFVNTHAFRVAGEYATGRAVTLRAGFDAYTAGAPDQSVTPILPDAPRRGYSAGAAVAAFGRSTIDVAYQFIGQEDRRGRTTDGGLPVPTPAINNGVYRLHANVVGVSLTLKF
jgi:long-chain fatty acid transport protein